MQFEVLTLFPEMFSGVINTSILKRAREQDLLTVNLHDIRDYAQNKHNQVDDYPYGGGSGMVLKPEPVFRAVEDLELTAEEPVVFLTPQGQQFDQTAAEELAAEDRITLLCGHYEGVDQRIRDKVVTRELSIGDYVLTGGEIPAMVVIDAVARLLPGVVGSPDSVKEDSFYHGLLDYPEYTRPQEYQGQEVPSVLLSGDHGKVDRWRKKQALKKTFLRRPDLLAEKKLSPTEEELLAEVKQELGKDE